MAKRTQPLFPIYNSYIYRLLYAGQRDSPGLRLYKQSEQIKKKHNNLRQQKQHEEQERLQRVPVAPPQHFDAIKYQQELLKRARNMDVARKKQEDMAQHEAQGGTYLLAFVLYSKLTINAELTFHPKTNSTYQMKRDRVNDICLHYFNCY